VIHDKIGLAGIARCEIERTANTCRVYIRAARPGLVIGRGGQGIEQLSKAIERALAALYQAHHWAARKVALSVNVEELKRTSIAAATSAQNIAWDLEKRLPFRRTMKKALENMMQNREIFGAKIRLSGRLDGNEIARREWLAKGKLPLQTLRANIDYAEATAFTTYGTIGIKVWLYRGDII
jgi:small subunit ribosomal protein S3